MPSPHRKITLWLLMLVAFMTGLTYASVPLYRIFCKLTGFDGTPIQQPTPSTHVGKNHITVYFDANVDQHLDWEFKPLQQQVSVTTGENKLIFYTSKNLDNVPITGMATFNVTPEIAAQYFVKVACFCFEQQTLPPKQQVEMPVSFYIDPAIEKDPEAKNIKSITLSYTFFESKK